MFPQTDEKGRLRRQHARRAIALALESKWEEAVAINRQILELFSDDVDALNRLGKALTELGRYGEARESYTKALQLSPSNDIARKNILRLSQLHEAEPAKKAKVDPHIFLEESGKTTVVPIYNSAPGSVLAKASAGDPLQMNPKNGHLEVLAAGGQYLGELGPKLAVRLINLMNGGNRYAAAVAGHGDSGLKIIIKEIYQHPSQSGRPSFPPHIEETFRPYLRDIVRRYELDEEEAAPEPRRSSPSWGEGEATDTGIISLNEEEQVEEAQQLDEEDAE